MNHKISKTERHDFWKAHIEGYRRSGLSQRDYCKNNNISYWSFNPWKRKFDNPGSTEFQEIPKEKLLNIPSMKKEIEIIINEKIRISIPREFSEDSLQKILMILGVHNEN